MFCLVWFELQALHFIDVYCKFLNSIPVMFLSIMGESVRKISFVLGDLADTVMSCLGDGLM